MTKGGPNNKETLSAINAGDVKVFENLHSVYSRLLLNYITRIIKDPYQAQDIAQESFIALWNSRKDIKTSPVSFLYRTAYNKAINSYEHKKVVAKFEEAKGKDIYFSHVIQRPEAEIRLIEKELENLFEQAKAKLPERCRLIFNMSRDAHMRNNDIAEELGISHKSVENQMTIAIRKLKKEMSKFIEYTKILLFF